MRVGVPKEIKIHEYRVGLTPGAVREYVAAGHSVVVETNTGAGIGASDEAYRKAGAVIAGSAAERRGSSGPSTATTPQIPHISDAPVVCILARSRRPCDRW